ncbi:hypothetical protein CLOM_g17505, partial [Closterium sp. NIES-68]
LAAVALHKKDPEQERKTKKQKRVMSEESGMASCATSGARATTIAVVGDCMLGRLVNHMLLRRGKAALVSGVDPDDQRYSALAAAWQAEQDADEDAARIPEGFWPDTSTGYIWDGWLPLLRAADCRIANLETSVTRHRDKWPNQAFNFRMHPANIDALTVAGIDFCSLANNHMLDFQTEGMRETMASLTRVGIRFAGCGRNLAEASAPAFIKLHGGNSSLPPIQLALFSAADHFKYWAATEDSPGIHLIDPERVTDTDLNRIAGLVRAAKEIPHTNTTAAEAARPEAAPGPSSPSAAASTVPTTTLPGRTLAVFCLHWGPNYAWQPSAAIRRLAHALVDRCGADLVIGTSAHHIQGVECHHGTPILYSCGDFIDDYRVDEEYRNDLSFLFQLHLDPVSCCFTSIGLFPNAIRALQASTGVSGEERRWLYARMRQLCGAMGTKVRAVDRSLRHLEIVL